MPMSPRLKVQTAQPGFHNFPIWADPPGGGPSHPHYVKLPQEQGGSDVASPSTGIRDTFKLLWAGSIPHI